MAQTCPVCNGQVSESDTVCPACGFKLKGTTQAFQFVSQTGNIGCPVPVEDLGAVSAHRAKAAIADADVTDESIDEPSAPEPPAKRETVLTVIRGPQTGVAFVLEPHTLVVGRDPKCDVFLNDMTVSRDHARIEPEGNAFKIIDDDSYNGVWINNENVNSALLHDGDFIQIGAFGLLVSIR